MSDNEELREQLRRAAGKAYGTGTDAADIVAALDAERERWQTVATLEQDCGQNQEDGGTS